MLRGGWMREVQALLEGGALAEDAKPVYFIGYREMARRAAPKGKIIIEGREQRFQQATRNIGRLNGAS